jgi:hypothetical protein
MPGDTHIPLGGKSSSSFYGQVLLRLGKQAANCYWWNMAVPDPGHLAGLPGSRGRSMVWGEDDNLIRNMDWSRMTGDYQREQLSTLVRVSTRISKSLLESKQLLTGLLHLGE